MKRGSLVIALGSAVVLLSLTATACGGSDDKSAADVPTDESTTTTAAPATTADAPKSEGGEDLSVFCSNATTYGFDRLDYVLPHTPDHGRELKAKLSLVAATAPEELEEQVATFRVTTDAYLDQMESGTINEDPQSVIAWSQTFDFSEIQATQAAQTEIATYIAANC